MAPLDNIRGSAFYSNIGSYSKLDNIEGVVAIFKNIRLIVSHILYFGKN